MIPYRHEPAVDFSKEENKKAFQAALGKVESELGKSYDLIVGGEHISTNEKITSINPGKKDQVIGVVSKANKEIAEKAMQTALETYETWRKWDAKLRADILFRTAAIVRRRKHEFSAWMVLEAGKPWDEADGDTSEAIDFMEFYARQMLKYDKGYDCLSEPGDHNEMFYKPMGVGVVISPWNFPFAIMAGMTVAGVVTGNTILLKPASNTPVVAAKFMEVLEEAGLPKGVVNFIPGSGSEVGDYLVDHPKTRFINFTGSRDVGTRIYERASKVQDGQVWLKRVVAEMGGKDTIVVDNDADLELAAQSIVYAAYGYAGQKCSACSRAVVHEDVYDEVLNRTVEIAKGLSVGEPKDENYMGPVIDEGAFKKIASYIEIGKEEGKLVLGGEVDDSKGYYIQPTIIADLDPEARLMKEEVFGPVLAFAKAKDFDEAIEIANNTDYALTGAVITRDRQKIAIARRDFHVGNLYINRGCTGSVVGYQPFGGFKMSGTDAKAGGPDYLSNFLEAKTYTEKL
ncbi:delta-1-pyrroline-5-carboxylate dehydrogenase [Scopulibacillus darangshiensis]|uniref:L-glutamate gamma-semialdehyde dehydrogenase n=1 Tax=Scopulibacillus darangshiensis TaxID=442528 RepID=A0A4R2NQR0_9BACL|nr:L-glutamate gamma-semialdehyde dehydrogenase [Scopulibacillus darangshiensis]TCP24117.1 delta-1-pyrroline-5-carboxylate dehydrogenase [Scopulibacillus darangshiensis]